MKKWLTRSFLAVFFLTVFCGKVNAYDYEITDFNSQIKLEQDSSLTVREEIDTNFLIAKHGIFRIIPYIYSRNGKTIRAEINVLRIENDDGISIPYTIENYKQSKKIKIGDANSTVIGKNDYFIEYKVKNVVPDYGEGPEIYWNVTGDEWEVPIEKASATIESPFGKIVKTECFGCQSTFSDRQANFTGEEGLTIVAQIDKNNLLKMPSEWDKKVKNVIDNWGYAVAVLPLLIMLIAWYKKGRDKRYLTENVFYKTDNSVEKNVSVLSRPHLPLVYSPIDGLSPSEVGTIIDEKFDTKDAVAEIVELARLEYLTIKKVENKGIFGIVTRDYELTKTDKTTENLIKYQKYLLESLFSIDIGIEAKTIQNEEIKKFTKRALEQITVKVSDLKDHFYIHLKELREKVYQEMVLKNMFPESPDDVRKKWLAIAVALNFMAIWGIIFFFASVTGNGGPVLVGILGVIPSLIMAWFMPRKTAKGYSLNRQAVGLKYYLSKGKWREEVAEKQLFLEEMLPLAITLGIVDQLATDMKDLGIEPPKYFQGMAMNSFVSDIGNFNAMAATGLVTAPSHYSGSGSWSGGSGFSGGGGGGFGGGGGGSW
ncbi:MAG: DUF2207 domain-containing protein [Candidatus Shapirobacteria bacterium]|jgi:uncharacterized membrane protein YgcG